MGTQSEGFLSFLNKGLFWLRKVKITGFSTPDQSEGSEPTLEVESRPSGGWTRADVSPRNTRFCGPVKLLQCLQST